MSHRNRQKVCLVDNTFINAAINLVKMWKTVWSCCTLYGEIHEQWSCQTWNLRKE